MIENRVNFSSSSLLTVTLSSPLPSFLPSPHLCSLKMRFSTSLSSLFILATAAFAAPSEVSDPRKCGNALDVIDMKVEAVMFVLLVSLHPFQNRADADFGSTLS